MKKVIVFLALLPLVTIGVRAQAPEAPPPEVEGIERQDLPSIYGDYKVDPYLAAAAKLQTWGKDKAIVVLRKLARYENGDDQGRLDVLLRMLFTPKPKPYFVLDLRDGFLSGIWEMFFGAADAQEWPEIELVDGAPFLLRQDYLVNGESCPEGHLDECIEKCNWSSTRFKPMSPAEKQKALDHLLSSRKWKSRLDERDRAFLSAQIK